jgi:glycosyltransferase involved in cell wall biosynthesis
MVEDVGVDASKLDVVPGGVDTQECAPRPDSRSSRCELGCAPEDFVVGTVGRLDPVRDYASLIAAVGRLIPQRPHLRLLLVGDGPSRPGLEKQARLQGLGEHVRFLGYRQDIAQVLNMLDLFVLPSLFEGTSNALLEAMAVGLPAVVTGVGGNREVVLDGFTGRIVPRADPGALTEAIEWYLSNPTACRQQGDEARARVLHHYSLDRMIDGYRRVYDKLLGRRNLGRTGPDRVAESGER